MEILILGMEAVPLTNGSLNVKKKIEKEIIPFKIRKMWSTFGIPRNTNTENIFIK